MPPILSAESLSVTFPSADGGLQALESVSFSVAPQEFVCVVGPSGCGKSTLLKTLAGLQRPTTGQVIFEGEPLVAPRRRIGFVFQKANLMPWRTAMANVTLPLELAGVPEPEARGRALDLIDLVGLRGFEGSRPRDLSGGMEQRVAIARALIHQPDLLLLDEPFGALDALTRERMGFELLRIWEARKNTVVMVTHSIPEAILLADRVLVMSRRPGRIRADLAVPLPRPRTQTMGYTEAFGRLAEGVRARLDV
jgi:NitT/TauT family transport system ATP-binding protein